MNFSQRTSVLVIALMAVGALLVPLGASARTPDSASAEPSASAAKKNKKRLSKQARANRRVYNKVKNGRFVGARGDGAGVDDTYCANGKYHSETTSGGSTGISDGRRWIIREAKFFKKGFSALIADPKEGYQVRIGRRKGQWLIAVAFDDKPNFGKVRRTNAKQACRAL